MALSLDEKRMQITEAFRSEFFPDPQMAMGWVVDIWDTDGYLVCEDAGEYYRVGYSVMDGEYKFAARADWVQVEKQSTWVEKVKALKAMSARPDITPADRARAMSEYGDVTFADEKNKKYPIDTEAHIRAAWNYINKAANAAKYSASEVAAIKKRIIAAWKAKIDKAGPPGKAIANNLKTLSKTDNELRVGNYIILFGGRDLEWVRSGRNADGSSGEFFTPQTNVESPYTKAGVFHIDWEHGQGKTLDGKDAPGPHDVLGYVDWRTARKDEKGIWVERALTRRNQYMQFLEELIDAGLVGTSSEALDDGIQRTKAGEILAWPIMRDTLTFSPAEPRMMTENVVTAIKSLAVIDPSLQAYLEGAESADDGDSQVRTRNLLLKAKAFLLLEDLP